MSPAVIVVVAVIVLTAVVLAASVVISLRQLRALMGHVRALEAALAPHLAVLNLEAAAAQSQLEAFARAREDAEEAAASDAGDDGNARGRGYTGVPQQPTAGTRHA